MRTSRVVLIAALWAAGCAGEGPTSRDGLVRQDLAAVQDQGKPADTAPAGCSAAGVAAACEPLTNSGCPAGAACYVVKGIGAACVCPAGATEPGGECTTTTACAPKHGCQGTTPPGSCVPYCDASDAACAPDKACPQCPAEASRCIPITDFTQFAICKP